MIRFVVVGLLFAFLSLYACYVGFLESGVRPQIMRSIGAYYQAGKPGAQAGNAYFAERAPINLISAYEDDAHGREG